MAIQTIVDSLYSEPDPEIPLSAGNTRRIANLQVYCYDEMAKRLNAANKGAIGSAGYFLRRLWRRFESGFMVHEIKVYSEQHEQSQKANRSKFEKAHGGGRFVLQLPERQLPFQGQRRQGKFR